MYSVFFKMSEIISNVLFGIAERIFLREKERFREEYKITIKPVSQKMMDANGDALQRLSSFIKSSHLKVSTSQLVLKLTSPTSAT